MLVILAHAVGTQGFPADPTFQLVAGKLFSGFRIFFVISGFLVTYVFLREIRRTGTLDLQKFLVRRAFRILPASYFYLVVMALLGSFGVIALNDSDLLHGYSYTMNYLDGRAWHVGHFWSLSVEQQFYLIWPVVLIWLGVKGGLKSAFAAMLFAPAARVGIALFAPSYSHLIGETFETVVDALATGCVLAGLHEKLGERPRYLSFLQSRWFWAVPAVMVTAQLLRGVAEFSYPIGETLLNVSFALILDRFVRFHENWFGRLLNSRPMVFVGGTLSYSLFLWQQPFLNRNSTSLFTMFPLNVVLAFCCAYLSYRFVELPMYAFRDRMLAAPRRAPVRVEEVPGIASGAPAARVA